VCKKGIQVSWPKKASKLKKGFASKTFNAAILDWYTYRPEHGMNIGIRTLARKVLSSSWKVAVEVGLMTWQTLKKYRLKRDSFMQSRI
jgi:hypothetical protein